MRTEFSTASPRRRADRTCALDLTGQAMVRLVRAPRRVPCNFLQGCSGYPANSFGARINRLNAPARKYQRSDSGMSFASSARQLRLKASLMRQETKVVTEGHRRIPSTASGRLRLGRGPHRDRLTARECRVGVDVSGDQAVIHGPRTTAAQGGRAA